MGSLASLMRKPRIHKAVHFLNIEKAYAKESIYKAIRKNNNSHISFPKNTHIELTYHATERWNERIGPIIKQQDLYKLLNKMLIIPNRIKMISNVRGLIDSDILFTYEMKQNTILITTFYGRISLQPALGNPRELKFLKYKQNERIHLNSSVDTINNQQLPIIPIEFTIFEGRTTTYQLEKYRVIDEKKVIPILYCKEIKNSVLKRIIEIDPANPYCPILNRSVLYILDYLDYKQFVRIHLEFHKPAEVKKAMEKYVDSHKIRNRNKI
jgi:hypothetical protein